jgi:NAD(P)-dependent dehydrogenase (short-subunit alcohol dehydrogenase family)
VQIAVITGASSGLGRALAVELSRRGWAVVVAARRATALAETVGRCREAGGPAALAVRTDVTVEAEVDALAGAALDAFGAIDAWINNAGVTYYAHLDDGALEDHRRVIETNLMGAIHGARAVLPIFKQQDRGVLVNVGSVLSAVGQPLVPSYVISKFGLRGLSEALRVELADRPDIHVCTAMPYALDTPHFQVAKNHLGRKPYALPPMQSPEKAAKAIADLVEHPRRQRFIPRIAQLGLALHAVIPRIVEHVLLDAIERWHIAGRSPVDNPGNLYEPHGTHATHGDRPPLVGFGRFFLWAAPRFVRYALRS